MWALYTQKNNCHISTPCQQKFLFPPTRKLLTVNVDQTKQCYLNCTKIYSSFPKLSSEILIVPQCSQHNSLLPFLLLYPLKKFTPSKVRLHQNKYSCLQLTFQNDNKAHTKSGNTYICDRWRTSYIKIIKQKTIGFQVRRKILEY